jgi:periplasmic copper chaperone A
VKHLMEGRPAHMAARMAAAAGLIAVGLVASACGGAAPEAKATVAASTPAPTQAAAAKATATATATPAGPVVTMSDVWARATPGLPNENSAIYAVLKNTSTKMERVVSASVPSTIAKTVELHTTVQEAGVMKMVKVEGFDIPASGEFKLQPGGNHIMLLGIAKQFKAGETFTVSLKLQSGAVIESKVEVKDTPGMGPGPMGGSGAPGGGMGPGPMGGPGTPGAGMGPGPMGGSGAPGAGMGAGPAR